jgi:hypothetical protein
MREVDLLKEFFLRLYPGEKYVSERSVYLSGVPYLNLSSTGLNSYYDFRAGPSNVMEAFFDFIEGFRVPRVEIVTDEGDVVGKDGFEFLVCQGIDTSSSNYVGRVYRVPKHAYSKYRLNGIEANNYITINGYSYQYVYQYVWTTVSYVDTIIILYGEFEQALFKFYLRDQYSDYKSEVSYVAKLHKRMDGYEIWYFDREYYAAGYSNNNSDGSVSDGDPPTLPSPSTELSEFTYFSRDEEGNYHLKIDEVLKEFKTKLKEKYKFNFLGVGDEISDDSVGDFQSELESSIEEINSAEPLTFNVEHRFDIVKGNFREPSIQVSDTELVFDYQKWFDVEILHVIRSIILFVLCVEFFFMTLKLFV